jgi:WD40 repeat protein
MRPQPRILLIEAATGEVRETIVAPVGIAVSLCFSPDGKTLASGGDGRVLLWDMTKSPGARSQPRD